MASYSDDFNRADGGLGSNWTQRTPGSGTVEIVSNAAKWVLGANYGVYSYISAASTYDQFVQVKIASSMAGGGQEIQVGLRAGLGSSSLWPDGYGYGVSVTNIYAFWYASGAYGGTLFNASRTSAIGDILRIEAVGDVVSFLVNGAHIGGSPFNDPRPAFASFRNFYMVLNNNAALDDFAAGDIGGAVTAFPYHTYSQMMGA